MTLATVARAQQEYFSFGPAGISMPSNLTIEFKVRFGLGIMDPGIYADHNGSSSMSVAFSLGGGLGGAFYLGADRVWLAGAHQTRASGMAVDTDTAFHTYRIELTGATMGSTINVYYDNSVAPLLSSRVVRDVAGYGSAPEISFGDKSTKDSGVSEWEYLWHNAASVPITAVPEPTVGVLLVSAAVLFGGRFRKR